MIFKARYQRKTDLRHITDVVYWLTITADDLRDAQRLARRYARKGFILAFLASQT
jgi:hypothetical protein